MSDEPKAVEHKTIPIYCFAGQTDDVIHALVDIGVTQTLHSVVNAGAIEAPSGLRVFPRQGSP